MIYKENEYHALPKVEELEHAYGEDGELKFRADEGRDAILPIDYNRIITLDVESADDLDEESRGCIERSYLTAIRYQANKEVECVNKLYEELRGLCGSLCVTNVAFQGSIREYASQESTNLQLFATRETLETENPGMLTCFSAIIMAPYSIIKRSAELFKQISRCKDLIIGFKTTCERYESLFKYCQAESRDVIKYIDTTIGAIDNIHKEATDMINVADACILDALLTLRQNNFVLPSEEEAHKIMRRGMFKGMMDGLSEISKSNRGGTGLFGGLF